jgi:hypothetical protein
MRGPDLGPEKAVCMGVPRKEPAQRLLHAWPYHVNDLDRLVTHCVHRIRMYAGPVSWVSTYKHWL